MRAYMIIMHNYRVHCQCVLNDLLAQICVKVKISKIHITDLYFMWMKTYERNLHCENHPKCVIC